jgi:uncharacterized membrane protein (UPF0127 family)
MLSLQDGQTGQVLYPRLLVAETFWRRAVGLLGRRNLSVDEAILLKPCRSVHTCFMRFPISIAFLDRSGKIIELRTNVPPWRFITGPAAAVITIETSVDQCSLRIGQRPKVVGALTG